MNGSPDSGRPDPGEGPDRQPAEPVTRLRGLTADLRARIASLARPIGLAFVVATVGAVIAIVASRGGHSRATSTPVATTPTPNVPARTATHTTHKPAATPSKPQRKPHPSKPARTQPVRRPTPAAAAVWPAGKTGYTVVLVSLPVGGGRTTPAKRARTARSAGLKQVGVIDSSGFPSLRPGYYVVFTGVYDTVTQAERAATAARAAGFSGAYPRRIAG